MTDSTTRRRADLVPTWPTAPPPNRSTRSRDAEAARRLPDGSRLPESQLCLALTGLTVEQITEKERDAQAWPNLRREIWHRYDPVAP